MLLRQRLLATGRYITVLPESVLRCNAKQWALKALPIDLGMRPMSVMMITVKNRTLSPLVHLFMEQVRAISKSMPSQ
jgi:DNA-binding transcriptional LysR family regulator